ncbi:MAG: hypothetical protein ACJ8J0_21085 [Longimicrobiaceae bacterium]
MRAYVVTTGVIFGLLTAAHLLRMFTGNPGPGETPWYIAITATTAALSAWAFYLLRRAKL